MSKFYDYLTCNTDIDINLSPEDRQSIINDAEKIINVLNLILDNFKSIKIKTVTDDSNIIKKTMDNIPRSLINHLMLLVFDILKEDDVKDVSVKSNDVKEIKVDSNVSMKNIIDIVDLLYNMKQ